MKTRYWIAAVALLSLLLGACQSPAAPDINESQRAGEDAESQESVVQDTTQASGVSAPDTEVEEQPAPVEVRQGLAATNPATVNLANGSPTFVEFFAFW